MPRGSPRTPAPLADECVIFAIEKDLAVLSSANATVQEQLGALKYLVHWVGDIHQPLQVSLQDDRDGNSIGVSASSAAGQRDVALAPAHPHAEGALAPVLAVADHAPALAAWCNIAASGASLLAMRRAVLRLGCLPDLDHRCGIGAGLRTGQGKAGDLASVGEARQVMALLLLGAVQQEQLAGPSEFGTITVTARLTLRVESLRITAECAAAEKPSPPYSLGMIMPRKPFALMKSQISSGIRCSSKLIRQSSAIRQSVSPGPSRKACSSADSRACGVASSARQSGSPENSPDRRRTRRRPTRHRRLRAPAARSRTSTAGTRPAHRKRGALIHLCRCVFSKPATPHYTEAVEKALRLFPSHALQRPTSVRVPDVCKHASEARAATASGRSRPRPSRSAAAAAWTPAGRSPGK